MYVDFNLTTCNTCTDCTITIEDKSVYLPKEYTGIVKNKFKQLDTIQLDVISNPLSSSGEYYTFSFSSGLTNMLSIDRDGYLEVLHIVLPSIEWFNREKENGGSVLGLYDIIYYTDSEKIYKYTTAEGSEEVLLELLVASNLINSTAFKSTKELVSICFLKKCFVNLCKLIFNNRTFTACFKLVTNTELSYKRDLIWMAINVIKYYTECKQFNEVQRLIDIISGCNGLCTNTKTLNSNGCGCAKN